MLRPILQIWSSCTQVLLLPSRHDVQDERTKGPLFNVNATSGRRDLRGVSYSPVVASEADEIVLAGDVFVRRVEWWKKGKWPYYHEFLVVYVEEPPKSDGKTPHKSAFVVERDVANIATDDREPEVGESMHLNFYEDPDGTITTNPPSEFPGPQPRESSSPLGDILASVYTRTEKRPLSMADRLTFSTDGTARFVHSKPETKYLCRTLTIHGDFISALELVLLARVIHDNHLTYELMEYQSFWFSQVMYTTIKTLIDAATSDRQSGFMPYTEKTHMTMLQIGQFQVGIDAYYVKPGEPDTARKIYQEYLAAWDIMKATIRMRSA